MKDVGVTEKLERLKGELLAELKNQTRAHTSLRTTSSFVACIWEEAIPKKFPIPIMGAYNGIGNPREHVINYKTLMELQTHFDTLLCKVFPTTLTGAVLTWFNNMKIESIKTFYDLISLFMGSFIASVSVQRKTNYLETVRQKKDKILREYVVRFNAEAL